MNLPPIFLPPCNNNNNNNNSEVLLGAIIHRPDAPLQARKEKSQKNRNVDSTVEMGLQCLLEGVDTRTVSHPRILIKI